jgi:hypothetical protein
MQEKLEKIRVDLSFQFDFDFNNYCGLLRIYELYVAHRIPVANLETTKS